MSQRQKFSWLNLIFGVIGGGIGGLASAFFAYQGLEADKKQFETELAEIRTQTEAAQAQAEEARAQSREIVQQNNVNNLARINEIIDRWRAEPKVCLRRLAAFRTLIAGSPNTHGDLLNYLDIEIASHEAMIENEREQARLNEMKQAALELSRQREAAETAQREAEATRLRAEEAKQRELQRVAAEMKAAREQEINRLRAEAREWNSQFDRLGRKVFQLP